MIETARGISLGKSIDTPDLEGNPKIMILRKKINDEEYMDGAIQRIALILSNELMNLPHGGLNYERRRKNQRKT